MKADEKIILFVLIQNITHLYTVLLTTQHTFSYQNKHITQLSHFLASLRKG